MERRVIVIVGPTCSGKTSVSIKLAEKLNTEIISADSRQIYKLLDIGTAKPLGEEFASVKHHFIDSLYPTEEFNASKFEKESLPVMEGLLLKGKVPIVTGGSGLYVKALIDGISDSVDVEDTYREELLSIKNSKGVEELYRMLTEVDPEAANTMLPQNWKRVIRALEVFRLSGKSILEMFKEQRPDPGINFIQFGLLWNRDVLYSNINARVDDMFDKGLVAEVENLKKLGFNTDINSLNTVGYKEVFEYLNGFIDLDRAVELIKRNTRRYAKRQMTWFNADKRIEWLEINDKSELEKVPEIIYNKIRN